MVVNLALQAGDGIATYYGLSLGIQEGNPLLRFCMAQGGIEWTLLVAKSLACGLLLFLREVSSLSVSQWALVLAAISYAVGSILPWSLVFLL